MVNIYAIVEDLTVVLLAGIYVLPFSLLAVLEDGSTLATATLHPVLTGELFTGVYQSVVTKVEVTELTMATLENYYGIIALLAIAVVFSTVAPVKVYAETAPIITNVVFSSETTGGVSTGGQAGKDGQAGRDGQSGQAGLDGAASFNTKNGHSSASSKSESVILETKAISKSASATFVTDSITPSSTNPSTTNSVTLVNRESTSSFNSTSGTMSTLQEILFSLRLILAKYVSVLF